MILAFPTCKPIQTDYENAAIIHIPPTVNRIIFHMQLKELYSNIEYISDYRVSHSIYYFSTDLTWELLQTDVRHGKTFIEYNYMLDIDLPISDKFKWIKVVRDTPNDIKNKYSSSTFLTKIQVDI